MGMEIIWEHPTVLLGDVGQVKACFGPFIDRCTVCAESTTGMETVHLSCIMINTISKQTKMSFHLAYVT
jgi:hypothetical protein